MSGFRQPAPGGEHDFRPTASLAGLRLRSDLLGRLRSFFRDRDFLEVDTPLLSADTVVDRHLDPLAVRVYSDPRSPEEGPVFWLQTSPEFAMKRLVAAYRTSVFQIAKAFRAAERGRWHNPEFTLVEWYDVGAGLVAGMRRLSDLVDHMLARGAAETATYRDVFLHWVGVDPLAASDQELRAAARRLEHEPPPSLADADRDTWLDWLLVEAVEPNLGRGQPLIVSHYPASQAALARLSADDPRVAERFELYVDGIELANGYHELLDASALENRTRANNRLRAADGKFELPENNRLLAAMRYGLPACTGVALGFDRLVMLAAGARSLDEVLAFPIERA